jgi:signal peptidase I
LRNDSLIINSQYVQEPTNFLDKGHIPRYEMRNMATHIVNTNSLFVLGDDRYNSFDSRNYGDVSMELIVGKLLYIYWSNTLSQIGHSLKMLK